MSDAMTGRVDSHVVLDVRGLQTHFFTDEGIVRAVDGVDLQVRRRRTLCVVGESGCGKSVTARSILQLVPPPGRVVGGQALLRERSAPEGRETDLLALGPRGKQLRHIRGNEVAMVFQEPMTSLSLVHPVGNQIAEAVRVHADIDKHEARRRAIELLGRVGIPDPQRRVDAYPFQLSGGMRQRAMIAMALSCDPSVLIADEPTTALDVTTQAQILELLRELQDERGMAIMFITHDMGVVAEMADDVAVMYLGTVVEQGPVDDIFHHPKHPYTQALLESIPRIGLRGRGRLRAIRGAVPHPAHRPSGCPFHPRCDAFIAGHCDTVAPPVVWLGTGRQVRCVLHDPGPDLGPGLVHEERDEH